MRAAPPTTNGAVLPGCGLPAWCVVVLDALLSADLLDYLALDGLDADALAELAREAVRHSLDGFDAGSIAAVLAERATVPA